MRLIGRILLTGLALVGLLTLLLGGVVVWSITQARPDIPERMLLTADLDRDVVEAKPVAPFARWRSGGAYVLSDLATALRRAAEDRRVTGFLARISGSSLSMAKAQELRDAVLDFRRSGKPAAIFSESVGGASGGTVAYYLASGFDDIWLQPSGDLALTGFVAESPFLKEALDELGIKPQFAARHEYKSAIDILTERGFTEENRESVRKIIGSWFEQVVAAVSEARGLDSAKLRALVDRAPLFAEEALREGLVDQLGYWDQARASVLTDGAETLDLARYGALVPGARDGGARDGGERIAVIYGTGAIQPGKGESNPLRNGAVMAAETIAQAIRDAADDPKVRAIILRIDSPGGSYTASDTIWHEVNRAREAGKKVVASLGGVAASGGYYVAMAADRIIAHPGTITGSIGVFSGKLVLAEFWRKLGVNWDAVQIGDNAGMWSANHPFSDEAWRRMNAMLDRIYADFTGKVAAARGLDAEAIDRAARGRVWSGTDAKEVGLVDALGGFDAAVAEAKRLAGIPEAAAVELVRFPKAKSPLEYLVEAAGEGRLAEAAAEATGSSDLDALARRLIPLARRLEALTDQGELHAPLPVIR